MNSITAIILLAAINLQPGSVEQGELDLGASEPDGAKLMGAIDSLSDRFGRGTVTVASAGVSGESGHKRRFAMRQDLKTPNCTTNWRGPANSAGILSSTETPTMTTPPLLPQVHVGAVDPNEPELPLASADVLRYVWHGRFGDMLLEVRDGQAFVNGQPVVPADRPVV